MLTASFALIRRSLITSVRSSSSVRSSFPCSSPSSQPLRVSFSTVGFAHAGTVETLLYVLRVLSMIFFTSASVMSGSSFFCNPCLNAVHADALSTNGAGQFLCVTS